ncbi:Catechol 1,2-dioxygenase [Fusarium oxysporum f. sp. albedinis]|nr:Catechol 1,2-dioxygenase [Fusarium oxysporum f. sp. albedinis]
MRKTTTRGTGCPFSVLAKESLDKTTWSLQHRPDKEYPKHNHPPSQHPSAHPVHRKLNTWEPLPMGPHRDTGPSTHESYN